MERELHQESREDLTRKTDECEQIYSEHEEEVKTNHCTFEGCVSCPVIITIPCYVNR